jgi:hypothetical protein
VNDAKSKINGGIMTAMTCAFAAAAVAALVGPTNAQARIFER